MKNPTLKAGRRASGDALIRGIILVCCAIEAILQLSDRGLIAQGSLRQLAYVYAAFWPGLLKDWQPAYPLQPMGMFVTYGFLHGGLVHLGVNMVTLWSLGQAVLARIGTRAFAILAFISLVAGAGCYGLLADSEAPMVGASGMLFGLAGAIVYWLWRARPTLATSIRATWRIFAFLVLYNVGAYWLLSGGLAWQAHLGGFLAGWIVAWWLARRGRR